MSDEEIKAEFLARQAEQRSISYKAIGVILAGLAAGYFLPCSAKPTVYAVLIAYTGFALYRTFKVWRCPACGRLLGDRIDIDACPRCRVKFR